MTYFDRGNKSIVYKEYKEDLIEIELEEDFVEQLTYEEVQEEIKLLVDNINENE